MKYRQAWTLYLSAIMALAAAPLASAQTAWPDRNVRLVVPYAPGGTTDFTARQIAQKLTEQTGKSFFVENKAGASGIIGTESVARAAPDGTTFLVIDTTFAMLPHLKKLPYAADDLVPVTTLALTPLVLVVGADSPYRTAQQLIDFARSHPAKLNYGSGGAGSSTHLGAELFARWGKLTMTHVPYKGAGDAMLGVVSNQVDLLVTAAPTAIGQVKGGKVRALLVTAPERIAPLPEVPTAAELGMKEFDASNWFGLAAPKGTPAAIVDKLQAETGKALADPALRQRLQEQGAAPGGIASADFQTYVAAETRAWGDAIKAAGVKTE